MKKQPLITILTVIIVLVSGLAIYYGIKSNTLHYKLQTSGEAQAHLRESLALQQELEKADALVIGGDYRAALKAYQEQQVQPALKDDGSITMRMAVLTELMRLQHENKMASLQQDQKEVVDSSMIRSLAIQNQLLQTDSLNFALEKARVQLACLKRQLKERSFGEYLKFTNAKGSQMHYVGQVKNGKANGFGVALLSTGSRYEGQWKENQRHGEGKYIWADGEYYEGSFINDRRNGEGTYYWPNGEKYTGHWKNDKRSGVGTFYGKEGDILKGIWEEDQLAQAAKRVESKVGGK